MKNRKSAVQAASGWLIAIYLLISTWIGCAAASFLIHVRGGSFNSVILLISLVLCTLIQLLFQRFGVIIGGYLSSLSLVAERRRNEAFVREDGAVVKRSVPEECLISPVIMASGPDRRKKSYTFYWLGGVVFNLLVAFFSGLILFLGVIPVESNLGCLIFGLLISGLWVGMVNGLPAYYGSIPNPCMKALLFRHDAKNKLYYEKDLKILQMLSGEDEIDINKVWVEDPGSDPDADVLPMNIFKACYYLRLYEALLLTGESEMATHFLAELYYHLGDLPEELQGRVKEESISALSLMNDNESHRLADRLVTPGSKKNLEQIDSATSKRCLYLWSTLHEDRRKEQDIYYREANDLMTEIPFPKVRIYWQNVMEDLRRSTLSDDPAFELPASLTE